MSTPRATTPWLEVMRNDHLSWVLSDAAADDPEEVAEWVARVFESVGSWGGHVWPSKANGSHRGQSSFRSRESAMAWCVAELRGTWKLPREATPDEVADLLALAESLP